MKDELWLRAAISDDKVVADLLLRLKDSADSSPSASVSASAGSFFLKALPPSWGVRQPRSKPSSTSSLSLSLSAPPEKKRDTRRSPTTPLSWTGGGASPSEGGCEESSELNLHHPPSDRFRSKISAASDTPTTSSKRPRRKKTFAELKEEEASLLKERTCLKKQLETLHMTLKEQRSINENLKRIKLDLLVDSGIKSEPNSDPHEQNTSLNGTCGAAFSSLSAQLKAEYASVHLCLAQSGASSQEPIFVLPDLNMSPDEECGITVMS